MLLKSNCPYCGSPIEDEGYASYCSQCANVVFACLNCGSWNRASARFCTHCGAKLRKPISWSMAGGNPARNSSISPANPVRLSGSWSVKIQPAPRYHDIPSLVTIHGLVVVPILADNTFQTYSVANGRSKWNVKYDGVLSYASTPICYGLSLYYAVNGGILEVSVRDGKSRFIIEDSRIIPMEGCAPLVIERTGGQEDEEEAIAVFGLKKYILIYDILKREPKFKQHDLVDKDSFRSPVLWDDRLIFTTKLGKIYEFSLQGEKIAEKESKGYFFSAPAVIDDRVYFQVVDKQGQRKIACYRPNHQKSGKGTINLYNLNEPISDVEEYQEVLKYSPIAAGDQRIVLSDMFSSQIYLYRDGNFHPPKEVRSGAFIAHQALSIQNKVYSASDYGILSFDLQSNQTDIQPLTRVLDEFPLPIAQPVAYGNKLFILCEKRLICHTIL